MKDISYRRATQLMEADLGDELVALDPAKGNCFGFNEVATRVWRQLEQAATFDQLRDGLRDEYDVSDEQCALELRALLDDLVERGLVARDPQGV
jgi:hypothetical protein